MLILNDWKSANFSGVVLSIGNFDGVHLGHRAILNTAFDRAENAGSQVVVLTFDPHPSALLTPDRVPPTLTPLDEKLRLLDNARAAATVIVRTDREFLGLTAEQFITDVILTRFKPVAVVEGPTFGFGAHRKGNVQFLEAAGRQHGFEVEIVPPVRVGLGGHPETIVSSSLIRHLLASGTVDGAALCMGRSYALFGQVSHGAARGRRLGFPTANLSVRDQLIPAEGVYAGRAFLGEPEVNERGRVEAERQSAPDRKSDKSRVAREKPFTAAISVGRNPTFGDRELSVEAFLLDYQGDLYECPMKLEFLDWLRPQQKFDSPAALIEQINRDVARTREIVRTL